MANLPARKIKIVIEYDGSNYNGWQTQKGYPSIQSQVIQALKNLTGEKTSVIGASRTDSGVHALGQVAHFVISSGRIPTNRMPDALNAQLPDDIRVVEASDVPDKFHAQFHVRSKTYRYSILNRTSPSAMYRNTTQWVRATLDIEAMRAAAAHLKGEHDFKAFTTAGSPRKTTIREIHGIEIVRDGDFIHFYVSGNGFLYNMVRCIVGTLLLVGQGRVASHDVKTILASRDRKKAGPNAPARGLCLIKVEY